MGIKIKETRLRIDMWNSEDTSERMEGSLAISPYATETEMLMKFEQWELDNGIDILFFDNFSLEME